MVTINQLLFLPIKACINVSDNTVNALKRLDILNLRDLLFHHPNSYQIKAIYPNLSSLNNNQLIQTEITITEILIPNVRKHPIKILGINETGAILLIFFNRPPYFMLNKLTLGSKHIINGKVQIFSELPQIVHPIFVLDKNPVTSIEPIYPLTYGIINHQLHSYIIKGLSFLTKEYNNICAISPEIKDYIKSLLEDLQILHGYQINSPNLEEERAQCIRRLAKKELFANQLSLQYFRKQVKLQQGNSFSKATQLQGLLLKTLEFELTYDQKQVIEEIELDQFSKIEMMRLLQGDVGSGKTLVALLTMLNVVQHQFQATLMAPTDLLANQHYQFFVKALNKTNVKLGLLTGKMSNKERTKLLFDLENGDIDILIGTHALFQKKVIFKNLGYIVIDEQHKFGVQQRIELINKASHPDVLIMTATPIPRSLTLTMFGDMDISKLTDKPKNRLPVITSISQKSNVTNIISALEKKIKSGEKIYWVCSLIDQTYADPTTLSQNTNNRLIDVNTRLAVIEKAYPNITGIVHGKMKSEQKDEIMRQFKDGYIKILVATTVIEVGIDVPDATLMVIENAEQFGLAQLHQIRGRVGRGALQSHCILIYDPQKLTSFAKSRLVVMKNSNDGFYIAEQDLRLRGSGEILGTKQSGDIRFFFADLSRDLDLLTEANKLATKNACDHSEFLLFQTELFTKVLSTKKS